MKLPGRVLDLSSPLDNETVFDPPFMRPKIEYRTNAENAPMLLDNFPGLRREDLPEGEGWAFEFVQLSTHNGTHMDAPVHYQSRSMDGKPMMTIDVLTIQPLVALIAGILILLLPQILNYVVAIYLIVIGTIGLWPHIASH